MDMHPEQHGLSGWRIHLFLSNIVFDNFKTIFGGFPHFSVKHADKLRAVICNADKADF